jgi:hypothetical protein
MPKSVLSLLLALTLILSIVPLTFSQDIAPLSNSDIVTMVRAKLPAALIIEKISNSSCRFDTFPSVLAELKYKGVPDDVLMAMVRAPHGRNPRDVEDADAQPARTAESRKAHANVSSDGGDRSAQQSVPGAVATGSDSRVTNTGGFILSDRSDSPYNARFFVAPMDEGFDGMISALMIEKKLPLRVVADENLADFIIVGNTNKGVHKWYDTVFGSGYERDRNQGSIRVIRVRDKTVIWGAQKGDRSFWWGAFKKGGKRKVAERLVNEMKGDLFKDNF